MIHSAELRRKTTMLIPILSLSYPCLIPVLIPTLIPVLNLFANVDLTASFCMIQNGSYSKHRTRILPKYWRDSFSFICTKKCPHNRHLVQ